MVGVEIITEKNWKDFISQEETAIILCWAAWNDESVIQKGIYESFVRAWKDPYVKFFLFNTDENIELTRKLAISSIPLLLYFYNSQEQDRIELNDKNEMITHWIEKKLSIYSQSS